MGDYTNHVKSEKEKKQPLISDSWPGTTGKAY